MDDNGNVRGAVHYIRDITERKKWKMNCGIAKKSFACLPKPPR
ncbi:hypothetical protein [Methanocella conradii]